MLTVAIIAAMAWAIAAAAWWRDQHTSSRRELAEAHHDLHVARAELEACRDTRRQLAQDLEAETAAGRRDRARTAP